MVKIKKNIILKHYDIYTDKFIHKSTNLEIIKLNPIILLNNDLSISNFYVLIAVLCLSLNLN
jgi:hypothetical protein